MRELKEDIEKRSERAQAANDVVTPWDFIATRLGSIDSRIVNDSGSIFTAELKNHAKLVQPMQHGSESMGNLAKAIPSFKQDLNDQFRLKSLGQRVRFKVSPFDMVSPDIETGNESYREKYKVRSFSHSLHSEYNGFNAFELQVAEALDTTGRPWCRNPVGTSGYRIPIQELGSDNIWFYPDFLYWTSESEVWALDPKGKHLLEAATTRKLLDISSLRDVEPALSIGFLVEGQYQIDQQGFISKAGKNGYTLIRKVGARTRATTYDTVIGLIGALA